MHAISKGSVCALFGLAADDARALIQAMTRTFLSRWEAVFADGGVPRKDFPALAEAFVNHRQ